jgi:ribosomal protein L31E
MHDYPDANHFWIIPVANRREQINRLLAEVERESYVRGWHDAIAALQAKAPELPSPDSEASAEIIETNGSVLPEKSRGRPAKAISVVRELISAQPGLRGVDIANQLEGRVIERTVRSCLHRLRGHHEIWQRKGRWYPRDNCSENARREALETPPH